VWDQAEVEQHLKNIQLDLNDIADGKSTVSLKTLAFQIGVVREMIERAASTNSGIMVAPNPPHPDCYMFGGRGCANIRLDVGLNMARRKTSV
jgi:hypothetical protein